MIIGKFPTDSDFFQSDFSIGFLLNLIISILFSYLEMKMLHFWGHPAYFVSPLSILSVIAVNFIIHCLDKWQTARKHKTVAE